MNLNSKSMSMFSNLKRFFKIKNDLDLNLNKEIEEENDLIKEIDNDYFREEEFKRLIKISNNIFQKNIDEYIDFLNEFERFPNGNEMNWVNTMRTMFNKGQLPKEYINAILNVNPNFFEKKIKTFDESLDEYRIFYETNKRFPNVAEMNWVDTMRTMFNKGQLSRKKINTILEVNPNFFDKKSKTKIKERR